MGYESFQHLQLELVYSESKNLREIETNSAQVATVYRIPCDNDDYHNDLTGRAYTFVFYTRG